MRYFIPLLLWILAGTAACSFWDPLGIVSGSEVTRREKDVSGKLALSLGGMAEGSDEVVLGEGLQVLDLQNNDPDLFSLTVRDGFDSYTEGNGGKVVPQRVGIGYVTPVVSGQTVDPVQVTIPPQKLVQILIGEARGEIDREATTEDDQVKPSSVSVTGDAVAAVIRNRIALINETGSPSLFVADQSLYESDPPLSSYEAVIEATSGGVYQFSPVDPSDPGNEFYLAAENRSDLEEDLRNAYDQAILTAADIFNGDTTDPTGGAFGFYSPTKEEYEALQEALESGTLNFPSGAGTSEANFPALAPLQVLLLVEIAPSSSDGDIPSFVFIRSRDFIDPAVTDRP